MPGGVPTLALALTGWTIATAAALVACRARRALTVRMELVARACHELRGPITAAHLGLQLGTRAGELSPIRLRAIESELGRTAIALQDLTEARHGRRYVRGCEEVDVQSLLADSVEAWRGAAEAGGVRLALCRSERPALVLGDRLRLAQATGNLIANAIEHGDGVVEVCAYARLGSVRVEVTDGGAGLPAPVADLARRAHRGSGSRGRGLAIAAEIAEDHGGRLAAAPARRGARLVLDLPVALQDASGAEGDRRRPEEG
ncbi:MAG: HAMP domain-containing histidine kinase [Actinomycetota bacterium]|nr:HAMP domain-containing histidine kinase [Actinomycetota bacterium]